MYRSTIVTVRRHHYPSKRFISLWYQDFGMSVTAFCRGARHSVGASHLIQRSARPARCVQIDPGFGGLASSSTAQQLRRPWRREYCVPYHARCGLHYGVGTVRTCTRQIPRRSGIRIRARMEFFLVGMRKRGTVGYPSRSPALHMKRAVPLAWRCMWWCRRPRTSLCSNYTTCTSVLRTPILTPYFAHTDIYKYARVLCTKFASFKRTGLRSH